MLFEFIAASLVLIAIPGPDQALITRNALLRGRAAGLRTMLGGATGLTVHATAAAFGISALLASSATAYTTLKFVGIAYLLYLGIRMLLTTGQHADEDPTRSQGRPFAQGLLSNALNPKIALFFLTFLPQFLPDHGATLPAALGLSAVSPRSTSSGSAGSSPSSAWSATPSASPASGPAWIASPPAR